MKQVLIIGAGGVGSHLSYNINELVLQGQFNNVHFTIADNQTIETKNLLYQKFELSDITDYKAEVIGKRYNFSYINKKIESKDILNKYDCLVSAVDNTIFRKLMYRHCEAVDNIYWIDLRSKGKVTAAYTKSKKTNFEFMLKTLPKDEVEESSCQFDYELEAKIVQTGNRIIACVGAQYLLNWNRGESNPPEFNFSF